MTEKTFKITLPNGLADYVSDRVEQGFFRDESEVIADVLRRIIHDDARLTFWAEDHVQAHANKFVGMSWKKSFNSRFEKRDDLGDGMVWIEDDAIEPVRIVHGMDEMYTDGVMDQSYNFIDYFFEGDGAHIRARHYLCDTGEVVIHGPFATDGESHTSVEAPEFAGKVKAYLDRRFAHAAIPTPIER